MSYIGLMSVYPKVEVPVSWVGLSRAQPQPAQAIDHSNEGLPVSSRPVVARRNFIGLIAGAAVSTLVATGLIAAAAYSGGVDGLAPTEPSEGDQLNSQRRAVIDYADYLEARQNDVAASVGADVGYSYTLSSNASSADLNARQAASLQSDKPFVALDGDEQLKLLEVVTGEPAPVATVVPKINGLPAVGKALRSTTGTWDVKGLTFAYQ